jgi:hypothetical protein
MPADVQKYKQRLNVRLQSLVGIPIKFAISVQRLAWIVVRRHHVHPAKFAVMMDFVMNVVRVTAAAQTASA